MEGRKEHELVSLAQGGSTNILLVSDLTRVRSEKGQKLIIPHIFPAIQFGDPGATGPHPWIFWTTCSKVHPSHTDIGLYQPPHFSDNNLDPHTRGRFIHRDGAKFGGVRKRLPGLNISVRVVLPTNSFSTLRHRVAEPKIWKQKSEIKTTATTMHWSVQIKTTHNPWRGFAKDTTHISSDIKNINPINQGYLQSPL